MQERSIIERLQVLEKKVDLQETLPERTSAVESRLTSVESRLTSVESRLTTVEVQLVQLRDEMRDEFSALRMDMRTGDGETRRTVREEIRSGDEETRRVLREEIRAGDEETRRYMRVLHEEVIARIALTQEGRNGG
jgi:hypothetical protein